MLTKGRKSAVMIGSANLTTRGLLGPNAEAVAILDVVDEALAGSLHGFVQSGFEFDPALVDETAAEREESQRQLGERIALLLECDLTLEYADDGLFLIIGEEAGAALAAARFEAAPFLEPDAWLVLEKSARRLQLLRGSVVQSEQTSLVTFRATSLSDPSIQRTWVLSLPVSGLDSDRRDRALLTRYVGASRFRDWLRSQLDGLDATAGQKWSDAPSGHVAVDTSNIPDMFALETMLSAWARDPGGFERRTSGMMAMLDSFREAFEELPEGVERDAALADLAEVRPFLQAVHDASIDHIEPIEARQFIQSVGSTPAHCRIGMAEPHPKQSGDALRFAWRSCIGVAPWAIPDLLGNGIADAVEEMFETFPKRQLAHCGRHLCGERKPVLARKTDRVRSEMLHDQRSYFTTLKTEQGRDSTP